MSWFKGLIKSLDYDNNNHHSRDPSHGHTTLGAMAKVWFATKLKREDQGNSNV